MAVGSKSKKAELGSTVRIACHSCIQRQLILCYVACVGSVKYVHDHASAALTDEVVQQHPEFEWTMSTHT